MVVYMDPLGNNRRHKVGALMRMGFGGILYYSYNKEPPKSLRSLHHGFRVSPALGQQRHVQAARDSLWRQPKCAARPFDLKTPKSHA